MELASINLQSFQVEFDNRSQLVVRPNSQGDLNFYPLSETPLFLSIRVENGEPFLVLQQGNIEGEVFRRVMHSNGPNPAFRVMENEGIGIADERNVLRVTHKYDLSSIAIALVLDGVHLEVICPGNPANGELHWYHREEEYQGNLSQSPS